MANKYSRYELTPYVTPYVNDQSVQINQLLRQRYDQNIASEDLLDSSLSNMNVNTFEKDEQMAAELRAKTRGDLERLSDRGDYENLGLEVRKAGKRFMKSYTPIKQNYDAYTTYKNDLLNREDLTPNQKQDRLRAARSMYEETGGISMNEKTGVYEGFFSGREWAKAVNLTEEASKIAKDMKGRMASSGQWVQEEGDGGAGTGMWYKKGQEGLYLTEQEIAMDAYNLLLQRPDVKAYLADESYMASSNYDETTYEALTPEQQEGLDDLAKRAMDAGHVDNIEDARKLSYGQLISNDMLAGVSKAVGAVYEFDHTKAIHDIKFDSHTRAQYAAASDVMITRALLGDATADAGILMAGHQVNQEAVRNLEASIEQTFEVFEKNTGLNKEQMAPILKIIDQYKRTGANDVQGLQTIMDKQGINIKPGQLQYMLKEHSAISQQMQELHNTRAKVESDQNTLDQLSIGSVNDNLEEAVDDIYERYAKPDILEKAQTFKTFGALDWVRKLTGSGPGANVLGIPFVEGDEVVTKNQIRDAIVTGRLGELDYLTKGGKDLDMHFGFSIPTLGKSRTVGLTKEPFGLNDFESEVAMARHKFKKGLQGKLGDKASSMDIMRSTNKKSPVYKLGQQLKDAMNQSPASFEIKEGSGYTSLVDKISADIGRDISGEELEITDVSLASGGLLYKPGQIYIKYEVGSGKKKKTGATMAMVQDLQQPYVEEALNQALQASRGNNTKSGKQLQSMFHTVRGQNILATQVEPVYSDYLGEDAERGTVVGGDKGQIFSVPGYPYGKFSLGYEIDASGQKYYNIQHQAKGEDTWEYPQTPPKLTNMMDPHRLPNLNSMYEYISRLLDDTLTGAQ